MSHFTKSLPYFHLLMLGQLLDGSQAVQDLSPAQKEHIGQISRRKRSLLVWGYNKEYYIPSDLHDLIQHFLYDNPMQYKGQRLPKDLSGQDLHGFDFRECQFIGTSLTDTNLEGVKLENSTCQYESKFNDLKEKQQIMWEPISPNDILKDLRSMAEVYKGLSVNAHKAKILLISSGLARLPLLLLEGTSFSKRHELWIRASYWYLRLMMLKKEMGKFGKRLTCSLEKYLEPTIEQYCWNSTYSPIPKINNLGKGDSKKVSQYIRSFTNDLKAFIGNIPKGSSLPSIMTTAINDLIDASYEIQDERINQEACNIVYWLSRGPHFSKEYLLELFLFCQVRIIRLKHHLPALKYLIDQGPSAVDFQEN